MRIIEKINTISSHRRRRRERRKQQQQQQPGTAKTLGDDTDGFYYSFEFFPPKTEAGLDNLLVRIERMANRLDPTFVDVTWGAGGSTTARSLTVASHAQRYCGVDVLLHLTCTGMTRGAIANVLNQAKSCGIQNVLALRGDPGKGRTTWEPHVGGPGGLRYAIDLVRLIRELHGDYFCVAVAGHPEGHADSGSVEYDLPHLRDKIDAGADFIITQFFYDTFAFLDYVRKCRAAGIVCPIVPGIMPIQSYSSFVRMTEFCGTKVPPGVMDQVLSVRDDDEAVKEIGCRIAAEMCTTILTADLPGVDGVHFYTLNLERSVTRILDSMGVIEQRVVVAAPPSEVPVGSDDAAAPAPATTTTTTTNGGNDAPVRVVPSRAVRGKQRQLPWRPSALENRSREEVRPINWANRPKSYVMRTEDWDEFPNGRWGDSTSPAFGELSDLVHFYNFTLGSEEDRREMLGESPTRPEDVYEVFARYVEGRVPHLPWCESSLQPESFAIQEELAALNRKGFLSVNSQPAVNGARSDHKTFGWGGQGGYVYQKAYCECFVSPENYRKIIDMVSRHPSMNLYAVNNEGGEFRVGADEGGVTALTWGVFPNREILQPTIFDPSTFLVWAEEAFSLWKTMWLNLYEIGSRSWDLLSEIHDTYYLVAIIDNDFLTEDNLWKSLLSVE